MEIEDVRSKLSSNKELREKTSLLEKKEEKIQLLEKNTVYLDCINNWENGTKM